MFGFSGEKLSYHNKWFFISVNNPEAGLTKMNAFIEAKKAYSTRRLKRDDGTLFELGWYE